jgi:hypothetical protein
MGVVDSLNRCAINSVGTGFHFVLMVVLNAASSCRWTWPCLEITFEGLPLSERTLDLVSLQSWSLKLSRNFDEASVILWIVRLLVFVTKDQQNQSFEASAFPRDGGFDVRFGLGGLWAAMQTRQNRRRAHNRRILHDTLAGSAKSLGDFPYQKSFLPVQVHRSQAQGNLQTAKDFSTFHQAEYADSAEANLRWTTVRVWPDQVLRLEFLALDKCGIGHEGAGLESMALNRNDVGQKGSHNFTAVDTLAWCEELWLKFTAPHSGYARWFAQQQSSHTGQDRHGGPISAVLLMSN